MEYKKLLHLTYEIEGLLMVQLDRPERHSAELDALIKEKISSLDLIVSGEKNLSSPAPSSEDERIADTVLMEDTEDADVTTEEPVQSANTTPVIEESTPIINPEIQEEELQVTASSTPETVPVASTDFVEEVHIPAVETIDEKLARDKAKDIFKAFTVNDKFRFRRELFRNSQAEFEETLEVISAMSSMDEAKEYFYEDLCWDPSNEDVKDFMEILAKHF